MNDQATSTNDVQQQQPPKPSNWAAALRSKVTEYFANRKKAADNKAATAKAKQQAAQKKARAPATRTEQITGGLQDAGVDQDIIDRMKGTPDAGSQ